MRKRFAIVAAAAALVAGAAQAGVVAVDPATGAERPLNWRWAAKPDAFKMALIMSTVSRHDAKTGDVGRVECVIGALRRPVECRVLSEPAGSHLGAATTRLAYYYKAPVLDMNGKSPVGRIVRVTFTLQAAGGFE